MMMMMIGNEIRPGDDDDDDDDGSAFESLKALYEFPVIIITCILLLF